MQMSGDFDPENVGRGVGRGISDRPGLKRIVCAFDEETFEQVRSRAVAQRTSFAEQVRRLVEWGLETK